ncbi:hypothetical protein PARC_b0256 [Pseudoalteromonas arctica A 37-1-2]|uniref:ABC transporter domain-containing protein n=1 Tax=Pseudoalteromonas arctica A 37-1-2 TaxID=1117313 RepID=A0A290S9W8_9GAMM|nr:hypothetical protein PARC_b0256 [Pseudoalteromonas arctica A 37-1-2]
MLLLFKSKGENRAGKSTLMKMLCGVIKPDQGDMFFNGRIIPINNEKLG